MIIQRILEPLSIRGKGRLADAILTRSGWQEVECHPIRGVTVFLRTNQRIERWMWAGAYERELVDLMKEKIRPGMTVLDVGANIGYFAAIAAALVGDRGQVHAFEPMPQNYSRLQKNLAAFAWANPHPVAVGETSGMQTMFSNNLEAGWSSLLENSDLVSRGEVEVIRLDEWASQSNIERIDFIKMDIEGSEFRALSGAKHILDRFRPIIVTELNVPCLSRDGRTPDDVLGLLSSAGYKCIPFGGGIIGFPV